MKILLHAGGSYGDVSPYITLAVKLKELGHEPIMVVPRENINDCQRHGIPSFGYIDFNIAESVWDTYEGFIYWCLTRLMRDSLISANAIMQFSVGAELVISHPLCPIGSMISEYYKIPIVDLLISAAYLEESDRSDNFFNSNWLENINDCRFSLGLKPVEYTSLSCMRNDNLKITLYPRELIGGVENSNLVYANFIQYYQDSDIPDELEEFLSDSSPLAVTLGQSIGFLTAPLNFMQVIEDYASLGNKVIVFSETYTSDNKNIFVCQGTSPHHKIFPRCSAVINHGGIGTIAKCLESNTPQIIVPQMSENAKNAEYFRHFCGVISPDEFNLEKLKSVLASSFYDLEEGSKYSSILNNTNGMQIILETLRNHKYLYE